VTATIRAAPSGPRQQGDELRGRLAGGILPALRASRPPDWPVRDETALDRHGLLQAARAPAGFDDASGVPSATVTALLAGLAAHLRARRELLLTVLFSPDLLLDRLREADGDAEAVVWLRLCWLAEAAWLCVASGPASGGPPAGAQESADDQLAPTDPALLRPVAARLRFLVLSEPLRHRAEAGSAWLPDEADLERYGDNGLPEWAFGEGTWHVLVGRCRDARWEWRRCLDQYESHPLLAQATPAALEAELAALLFARRGCAAPLVVSWAALADPAPMTADDQAVIVETVEGHLLPRFELLAVARLGAQAPTRPERVERRVAAALVLAAVLAPVVLAAGGRFRPAAWVAGACYALLGVGALRHGRVWAAQWLLRLPAAAAVGLFVLLSLPPAWWSHPRALRQAPAILVAAAYAYLVAEAGNHGVGSWAALRRSAVVAVAGAAHAFLVCLVGLVLVAPSYADSGAGLTSLWERGGGRAWSVVALAGAWCLAVGVFSQILWDDRPITAPLAHLQWRRER
jgi:hypothetical protein